MSEKREISADNPRPYSLPAVDLAGQQRPALVVISTAIPARRTSIAIVDGDLKSSGLLVDAFARTEKFQYLGLHQSGKNALEELPAKRPDMVLIGMNLPDISDNEFYCRFKLLLPQTQMVLLTTSDSPDSIFHALAAGANGCLSRHCSGQEILAALMNIQAAGSSLNREVARRILSFYRHSSECPAISKKLSPRQLEVLELLAQGRKFRQIARSMNISEQTVPTHVRRLYKKLQVRSRSQAVAIYNQLTRCCSLV